METNLLTPVPTTDESITTIYKLLLNSWSAEYALRITPILDGEAYRQRSILWSFPQTYYSALFSFRAVMQTLGRHTADSAVLAEKAAELHQHGLYAGNNLTSDYLTQLKKLRDSKKMGEEMEGLHALDINDMLVNVIDQINEAHEAHILSAIGPAAYRLILDSLPAYLRGSFMSDRVFRIMQREGVAA